MKKSNLFIFLMASFLAFSLGVGAQKPEATAKAAELMTQGNFREAIAVLDKAAQKNQDLYAVYKMRASLKRMTGDFAGALNDFGLAIERKADDGELYEQRAMMRLYSREDPALILADLDSAISYGRKHEKVYATRAMIRAQLRDFDGAINDYETAIGLKPDYAGAYIGLSGVYGMTRNEAKSAEVLEKFIAMIENSDAPPETVKGSVVATSGANQVPNVSGDKSATFSEGAVIVKGIESKNTTGNRMLTPAEATESTSKLEQTKNTAAAYSNLANIYQRRNDLEKASELVEKALRIDPQDFSALEVRGKIRTARGNYSGAIGDFDAALKLMPRMPPVYLARGIANLLAGSEAEAQKDFDKYLELFPNGKPMLEREIENAKQKLQQ
jgi:tetratricopeptide (TPR) repeat protein